MEQFTHAETKSVAFVEMDRWGLIDLDWTFVIAGKMRSLGTCNSSTKTLTIRGDAIDHDSKEQVINIVRHEIAHALHYEAYAAKGMERELYEKRYQHTRSGGRWVRSVPPHGAEWKRFADRVGVMTVRAAVATNIPKKPKKYNWSVVMVTGGEVKDVNCGLQRFPKRGMSGKSIRGHRGSRGKLFLVKGMEWKAYLAGRKTLSDLRFFQDSNLAPVSCGIAGLLI